MICKQSHEAHSSHHTAWQVHSNTQHNGYLRPKWPKVASASIPVNVGAARITHGGCCGRQHQPQHATGWLCHPNCCCGCAHLGGHASCAAAPGCWARQHCVLPLQLQCGVWSATLAQRTGAGWCCCWGQPCCLHSSSAPSAAATTARLAPQTAAAGQHHLQSQVCCAGTAGQTAGGPCCC